MAPLKIYYLSAEVAPFSDTYRLASFSREVTNKLHLNTGIDIRVSKPKYGFVSERKYILREVIRLRDIPITFNKETHIVNVKSSFIPDTRVQVYFLENNSLYKELPELIYKARNGRVYNDIDIRFAFFSKAVIDTLQSLFWRPDIIICNDWQTSIVPTLFKEQFINQEFYSGIKTVYLIHSINDYQNYSNLSYKMLNIDYPKGAKKINNHIQAMDNADLTILINYASNNMIEKMQQDEEMYKKFQSSKHLVIDVPDKVDREKWSEISSVIETACKDL